jgi:hypothetical protein
MISETAARSYTECLLIDQVSHTTLLFPVVAKSQAMQVVQAFRIAWRSALEATSMDQRSLHIWWEVGPLGFQLELLFTGERSRSQLIQTR